MGAEKRERQRRCRVMVRGRVQGVFYRASLRDVAEVHAVRGWVRNAGDGSVEAVLEGTDRDVKTVIDWCRTGPPGALVTAVEVADAFADLEMFQGFEIRY